VFECVFQRFQLSLVLLVGLCGLLLFAALVKVQLHGLGAVLHLRVADRACIGEHGKTVATDDLGEPSV